MNAAGDRGGGQPVSVVAQLSVRRGRAAIEFYKAAFGRTPLIAWPPSGHDPRVPTT
jgi:hypothetical protein